MKKRISSTSITKFLCIILAIWTIITFFIAYKKIANPIIGNLVNSYIIFIFFFIFYILFITIVNIRKLEWFQIKKKLYRFFLIFIGFLTVNVILTYLIKGEVTILNHIFTPLGIAFGISFIDVLFTDKKSVN